MKITETNSNRTMSLKINQLNYEKYIKQHLIKQKIVFKK